MDKKHQLLAMATAWNLRLPPPPCCLTLWFWRISHPKHLTSNKKVLSVNINHIIYIIYMYTYISIIRMNIWIICLISDVFRSLLGARTWKQLLPLFSCEPIATWCDNVQYFSVLQYNVASGIFKSVRSLRATLASSSECPANVLYSVCGKCHLMEDFFGNGWWLYLAHLEWTRSETLCEHPVDALYVLEIHEKERNWVQLWFA